MLKIYHVRTNFATLVSTVQCQNLENARNTLQWARFILETSRMKKAFLASMAMAILVISSLDTAAALTSNNPYTANNTAAKVTVMNQFMTRIAQKGESFNDLERYSNYLSTKISQLNALNSRFANSANHTNIIGYLLYEFNALFNDVSSRKAAADSQEDIDTLLTGVTEGGTNPNPTGLPLIQNVRSVTTGNSTVSVFSWDTFSGAASYRIFLTLPTGTVRQIAEVSSTSLYLNTSGYATGAYKLGIEALNTQLVALSARTESLFGLGTAIQTCVTGVVMTNCNPGTTGTTTTTTTTTTTGTPITDFRYTIANNSFAFVWNAFAGASKYRLFHVTDAGAENLLAEVGTNAYVLQLPTNFPSGTYRIRLQAFNASDVAISQKMSISVVYVVGTSSAGGSDGTTIGGTTTTGTSTNANLPSVSGLTARSQGSSVLVSWNDLPGTARYKLYSVSPNGAATLLSEVPGLSYFWTVTGINITGYKLRVEAINSAGTVISNAVETSITY